MGPEIPILEERQSLLPGGPGSRRRRLIFFGVAAALLVAVVVLFRSVLLPFVMATVIAYVLSPVVSRMQRIMARWVAVLVLYLSILGLIAGFVSFGVPRLGAEMERLAHDAPRLVRTAREQWLPWVDDVIRRTMAPYSSTPAVVSTAGGTGGRGTPSRAPSPPPITVRPTAEGGYEVSLPPNGIRVVPDRGHSYRITSAESGGEGETNLARVFGDSLRRLIDTTQADAVTIVRTAQSFVGSVVKGVFEFFITLMISAYLLLTKDRIFGFLRTLVRAERQTRFDDLVGGIDRGLSGVVRGQVVICAVNGVLSGIGFYLLDLDYWPILTLIATVLSLIPIFGSILSSIPAVLIGLHDSFGTGVAVLACIVGIHQLEANVLNPKILGDAAKVNPVLVMFSLLAGAELFGFVGALLAVPVLSIVQNLFYHFREIALGVPSPRSMVPPPPTTGATEGSSP